MLDIKMLSYGFVVHIDGLFIYDHALCNAIDYATPLIEELKTTKHSAIAKRFDPPHEHGVSSPIFRHESSIPGVESFQSAYYLMDALTAKQMLPVFLPETEEVKDLMPLLSEDERTDALSIIQILRARYLKTEQREPHAAFMVAEYRKTAVDPKVVNLSDADMLKIFGRLPNVEKSETPVKNSGNQEQYISEVVARRA